MQFSRRLAAQCVNFHAAAMCMFQQNILGAESRMQDFVFRLKTENVSLLSLSPHDHLNRETNLFNIIFSHTRTARARDWSGSSEVVCTGSGTNRHTAANSSFIPWRTVWNELFTRSMQQHVFDTFVSRVSFSPVWTILATSDSCSSWRQKQTRQKTQHPPLASSRPGSVPF